MNEDLEKAKMGDRGALGRLLGRQEGGLRAIIMRRLDGLLEERAHVSDLLQSGFLVVIQKLPDFRGTSEEQFTAWVIRIIENRIRQRRRFFMASKRRPKSGPGLATFLAPAKEPSSGTRRLEDVEILARAFDALPEHYRKVLFMSITEDRSQEEIAEKLGKTLAATRMMLSRARASLAMEIERFDRPES